MLVLNSNNSVPIECPKCKTDALAYKVVTLKYKGADIKAYHYKIKCPKCRSFHVKRNKEMYELLKDTKWIPSKNVLRLNAMENGLFS